MTGYVKLFQSILGSSIWLGDDKSLRVWIAMLVLKDRQHIVKISLPGLANIAKVTPDECRAAIQKFLAPDPDSSSKEFEGRKVEELPEGGWKILNGAKYAAMLSYEERKEYNRVAQQEHRKRSKQIRSAGKKAGASKAISEGIQKQKEIIAAGEVPEGVAHFHEPPVPYGTQSAEPDAA